MNTSCDRISRAVLFIFTFSVLYVSTGSARDVGGKKPKAPLDGIPDSLQAALHNLSSIIRRLDTEWSAEWKHALKESKEASDRAMIAAGTEYDSAMADLNRAMREMETALNAPNGASVRNSLRQMDSEMKVLKEEYPNLHLDSILLPSGKSRNLHVSPPQFQDLNIESPEIDSPAIVIPQFDSIPLVIPKMHIPGIDGSIFDGSIGTDQAYVLSDGGAVQVPGGQLDNRELRNLFADDNFDSSSLFSGSTASSNSSPRVTREYYSDGHTRFFIQNPLMSEQGLPTEPVKIWPQH